ncbi:hypothetical protein [Stenotrophomonas sp.]|uniref:hypothetical protein n=1 Tax=Stenotrophomonas sp. TaxID=69392 RepID=UPI0028A0BF98|nr:hypothetical protein [Stenotrophomonas sp.]
MNHPRILRAAGAGLLLAAMANAAAAPATPYVDLVDYPTEYAQGAAFSELRYRLQADFDDVCADTICEGQFSDYQALKMRCAVSTATGTLTECRWAFAASELGVDPDTGKVVGEQPRWLCTLPIPAGTSVAGFFAALEGPRALFKRLPGAEESVFEAIGGCLGQAAH